MATQAANNSDPVPAPKKRKPVSLFPWALPIAVIGVIPTILGFIPTFFIKLGSVDALHLWHGFTMIGWIALVLAQVLLINKRQFRYHRLLGWSSLALFASMAVSSWLVFALMLSGKSGLPFPVAKFFGYSDFADAPLMLFAFGGAIWWRKDRHLHARLMAVTVMTSIVPALARMFNILFWRSLDPGLYLSMHPTYLLILGTLGLAALADWRAGKLRWPLPLAIGWFAAVYATQWPVMHWQWYDAMCRAVGATA